jgi:sporulation protein YlmC with PRC-barrel domain
MQYDPDQRVSSLTPAWDLQGFRLPDAYADVRGWEVFAYDGTFVGTVSRFIVDTRTRVIRYVAVMLKGAQFGRSSIVTPRNVLVPVGLVRRVDDRHVIELEQITTAQLARAPRLPMRAIIRADEYATLATYGLAALWEMATEVMYSTPFFDAAPLFQRSH